ncbi:hypothetical protein FO519_010305, partial [Halicephalobus sp. NKZ332]
MANVKGCEDVFGVAHIYSSLNDTFIHVTDLSGRETIVRAAESDESSPRDIVKCCKEFRINALHVKVRATKGSGTQNILDALTRSGMKIGHVENAKPIASDKSSGFDSNGERC